MQVDLAQLSVEQLEALGFRTMKNLQREQNNMSMIEQEIANRQTQLAAPNPPKDSEEKASDNDDEQS